ncbi:bomanin-836 [Drosophila elegans]|uniref:bomanin-836 n=1 Tax=Drosophila elegans TaxID=30023 RepID=UPI0007E7C9A7|nr:bomanin-836 [Drosophila elegans]
MKSAGALMLIFCLLVAVNATPGKVYINGKCIDCNKPDNDDGIIMPPDHGTAGSISYTLTSGAIAFGILYHLFSLITV